MTVFWVVGEPSGDLQAAAVARALGKGPQPVHQVGWGGTHMAQAGVELLHDPTQDQFMGFVEVVRRLSRIRRMFAEVQEAIERMQPDVVVLVDYPGFNLRVARWAKAKGLKVVYYIPPKVWAWKSGRAKKLAAYSDLILSILPFEQAWYKERGLPLTYVGNPLAERYAGKNAYAAGSKKAALMPGSRKQEVEKLLPVMLEVARRMTDWHFVLVRPEGAAEMAVEAHLSDRLEISHLPLEQALDGCEAALVCSGTATLEVALLGVPQLVVYKANAVSLRIAKWLVKLPYFSLPNLILERLAVPELLQEQVEAEALEGRLRKLAQDPSDQFHAHEELLQRLSTQNPAQRAAELIVDLLQAH